MVAGRRRHRDCRRLPARHTLPSSKSPPAVPGRVEHEGLVRHAVRLVERWFHGHDLRRWRTNLLAGVADAFVRRENRPGFVGPSPW